MAKKKLRICMVTSEFPPKWGGVGNGVHFQSNVYANQKDYEIPSSPGK